MRTLQYSKLVMLVIFAAIGWMIPDLFVAKADMKSNISVAVFGLIIIFLGWLHSEEE